MPSGNPSGDWIGTPIVDDFPNTIAGTLGWTSAVAGSGANVALSTLPATAALCKMSGGVVSTVPTAATSIAANELLGMTLNNANGVGVYVDFDHALDTALTAASTATYAVLAGIFDSAGAVTTGNFIGLMYGWNPVTNAPLNGYMICADTVARLTANTPSAQVVQIPLNIAPALDVTNNLRLRINPAWTLIGGSVNGVAAFPQIGVAAQLSVFPNLLVPANGIPNITNGWLGFKMFAVNSSTTNTGKSIIDIVQYSLPGRNQNS